MSRTFTDWLLESGMPENRFLEEMERLIPWVRIEGLLKESLPNPGGGRPPYPFILLFRMTLLQWWHGLSDRQTELQCADRFSFRWFLGLGVSDSIPDASTLEDFSGTSWKRRICKRSCWRSWTACSWAKGWLCRVAHWWTPPS